MKLLSHRDGSPLVFIYEDDDIYVVNKPAGIHTIGTSEKTTESLSAQLLELDPSLSQIADKPDDAGLLQRLDQMTSGLIVGAKNKECWSRLKLALQSGGFEKKYLALVEGEVARPLQAKTLLGGRYRGSSKVQVTSLRSKQPKRALPANSFFSPISYFDKGNCTLVDIQVDVGRRHQIRAHAAYLGYPLVGDSLYGAKSDLSACISSIDSKSAGIKYSYIPTFLLHAYMIKLRHPTSNEMKSWTLASPIWILPKSCLHSALSFSIERL